MPKLIRSAFVIARRDFTATVFSKAFLFFLLGPFLPVIFAVLFGGIGARVAAQTAEPTVAVIASHEEFNRLAAARDRLASGLVGSPLIRFARYEPDPDATGQVKRLLQSRNPPVLAVLVGGLSRPHLIGGVRQDGVAQRQLRLMIAAASAPDANAAPPIAVTHLPISTAVQARERTLTAQAGQFLLFFLTILLAGMLLSQLIEEKSNKIIEVLAAAVPIDAIFLGKLFAMLATSIVGIAVWFAAGAGAIALFVEGGIAQLSPPAVGWGFFIGVSFAYFTMNYLLLGAVFLSIGAQASTVREVQTLSMPVTMAQVAILGIAALAIGSPDSPEAIATAVFPLSSPLVMVARAAERPELWPHLLAIGWQLAWVAVILRFGAKLFRRNVMKSGQTWRWRFWRRARP